MCKTGSRQPVDLPPQVAVRLAAFLLAGQSGRFVPNIKQGRILGAEVTDSFRLDKEAETGAH